MKNFFLLFILLACSAPPSKLRSIPNFQPANYVLSYNQELSGTICFIGDAGHGKPGQFLVGKALAKENCEHIWYTGDIIYPDGLENVKDTQFQSKFALPYKPVIDNPQFNQFHMALGNHDHKGNADVWSDLSKIYSYIRAPHWYFVEKWKNACVFVFDTDLYMRPEYEQRSNQDLWAKHQIQEQKNSCPISIAVLHHPYISSGGHGDSTGALKKFHEQFTIGHFDLMVSGHDHLLTDEGVYHQTRLLISGAASETKYRIRHTYQKGYEGSTLGFIKVILQNKKISYEFIEVTEENGEPKTKVAAHQEFEALGLR